MAKILALVNDKSGAVSTLGVKNCVRAIHDISPDDNILLQIADGDPGRLINRAADAVNSNEVDKIYAVGGDGTMAALAGVLVGSDVGIAPLPGGTMNALSRDVGFEADLSAAIRQLSSTQTKKIDVGFFDDLAFLNNVVFGAYARMADSREHVRDVSGVVEKIGAIGEVVAAVTHSEVTEYSVTINGTKISVSSNTLMIANNFYDGADLLRPIRDRLDSGMLGVYLIRSQSPADFLTVLYDAVSSGLTDSNMVKIHKAKSCVVDSENAFLEATVDGEVVEKDGPVKILIKPKSLNVIAPD